MNEKINEALIDLGFKKSGKYYKKGGNSIKIYEDSELSSIFKQLIEFGETKKVWEFKRTMQITDGR